MRLNDRVQVLLDLAYHGMYFRHVDLSVLHSQRKVVGASGSAERRPGRQRSNDDCMFAHAESHFEGRHADEGRNVGGRARLAADAGIGVQHRFVESNSLHRPHSSMTADLRQSADVNNDDRYRCRCTKRK
jgi:hypothetical protein